MKTSHLLPEECKQEIRDMIAYNKQHNDYQAASWAVVGDILNESLGWVLEEEK